MESTFGEDFVRTAETTIKNLEYYINLADKAAAGFEGTDSNFEISSIEGKFLSKSTAVLHVTEKSFVKGSSKLMRQTALPSYFDKLPQPPYPSATTTLISWQPPISRQDPPPAKAYESLTEGSEEGWHFLAIQYILIKLYTWICF